MDNIEKYRGVFPALLVGYDASGSIDCAAIQRYAVWLADKGVNGLYVCGGSGECVYLSAQERMKVLDSVMSAVGGRIPIIAHVAAASTVDSVMLAKHARKAGVDAIAAIPPIYFHVPEDAIAEYWLAIADAGQLDFFIYNIPQLAGYALSLELLQRMREHPCVIGMKNSSHPAQDIVRYKRAGGKDFVVFNGADGQYLSGRVMGASGGIGTTYSAMPELFLALEKRICANDLSGASAMQYEIGEIIHDMISQNGNLHAVCKGVLKERGIDLGTTRPPLPNLNAEGVEICVRCAARIERVRESLEGTAQ